MRAILFAAGALLLASVAHAEEEPDYPVIPEHQFVVVESGTVKAKIDEEKPLPTLPEAPWAKRHLDFGAHFVDPFVGTELYPEISIGTSAGLDAVHRSKAAEFRSDLDVSLYVLQIRLPLASLYDGNLLNQRRLDLSLKLPWSIPGAPRHRFALVLGALVPSAGPALQTGRTEFLYGWGGPLSFQVKLGYGYEQLFADQPPRLGGLYGFTLGVPLGWIQPVVQLDGVHTTATKSDRVALLPGVQIFPLGDQHLQLSVAALIDLAHGADAPAARAGAWVALGFNFL